MVSNECIKSAGNDSAKASIDAYIDGVKSSDKAFVGNGFEKATSTSESTEKSKISNKNCCYCRNFDESPKNFADEDFKKIVSWPDSHMESCVYRPLPGDDIEELTCVSVYTLPMNTPPPSKENEKQYFDIFYDDFELATGESAGKKSKMPQNKSCTCTNFDEDFKSILSWPHSHMDSCVYRPLPGDEIEELTCFSVYTLPMNTAPPNRETDKPYFDMFNDDSEESAEAENATEELVEADATEEFAGTKATEESTEAQNATEEFAGTGAEQD